VRLEVWLNEALVGWLAHDGDANRFAFTYAPQWLAQETRFGLSPSLRLPDQMARAIDGAVIGAGTIGGDGNSPTPEAHSAIVRAFFENLLPEGQALDDVAAVAKTSKSNLVGLLIAVGRESAGAFRIRPEDVAATGPNTLRHLPRQELSQRIRVRGELPFSVWDRKVRLSIAGFQDKIGAFRYSDEWYLADGDLLASTHILKPEPRDRILAGLTSNEFFCMRLAAAVKVPSAKVELHHVPEPVLSIERFDRRVTGGPPIWSERGAPELSPTAELRVERIHVIDGCQALGVSALYKYERPYGQGRDVADLRTGASYPRLFNLLRLSPTPTRDRLNLLRWSLFQVLIGNTDAHAKNLSFYFGPQGLVLAPAYDLVSGASLPSEQVDKTFAMAIGDAFESKDLNAEEWVDFTARCGLNYRQVASEMADMINATVRALLQVKEEATGAGADMTVVQRVVDFVRAECDRQRALLPGIVRPKRITPPSAA